MTRNKLLLAVFAGMALICSTVLLAQRPAANIDSSKHPNLAAAQHHIQEAYDKAVEAQQANKDQLGGHDEKAKQHLIEADQELKLAAEYADHRK